MGKKRNRTTAVLLLVFGMGLSLLLYPTVSELWNRHHQTHAIVAYDRAINGLGEEDYRAMLAAAEAYNESLLALRFPFGEYEQLAGYEEALNVLGDGILGYISIPRLQTELPVYHGTTDGVLSGAVGHLEGSSLPVGGASTHAVLSGHSGLPSAKLFTDLDTLAEGDVFILTVLGRELLYEVDQISVVEPEEIEELYIREGEDLCTLVTCTPYGVNSHRLLVRGHRVWPETPQREIPRTGDGTPLLRSGLAAFFCAGGLIFCIWLGKGEQEVRV